MLYYTKSFNYESLSTCNEDNTLTIQCIFVVKNNLLALDLLTPAFTLTVMFYDYFLLE